MAGKVFKRNTEHTMSRLIRNSDGGTSPLESTKFEYKLDHPRPDIAAKFVANDSIVVAYER